MHLMNIAAHIDTIEGIILPALHSGTSCFLHRFWWSTKMRGLTEGVNKVLLENMIEVELAAWGSVLPERVFLIRRRLPLSQEHESKWNGRNNLYERIAMEERRRTKVAIIDNDTSIEDGMRALICSLDERVCGHAEKNAGANTLGVNGHRIVAETGFAALCV